MQIDQKSTPAAAWVIWSVGVVSYSVAVLHRTSFGVAGIDAAERFGTSAGVLGFFTVLQVLVYAAMQVPVGMLLDRLGARRMVAYGAAVMSAGQLLLAVAPGIGPAIVARVLVGAGDAMTFISVLSLVPAWFPHRRIPMITQLTGLLGQLGQVLSAVPLVALLHGPGWGTAFGSAAGLGVLICVLALAVLRDSPPGTDRPPAPSLAGLRGDLAAAWRHPGTRLGMWSHFVTQFPTNTFALMWGYPYLVSGQHLHPATASALLTVFVLAAIAAGPLIGRLVARHPLRRSWLVLGITALTAVCWALVLAVPPPVPVPALALLVVVTALGGPGSMIGFDFARTFNPPTRIGTASGIVNAGGFCGALVSVLLIGLALDRLSPDGGFTPSAFRVAWLVMFPLWGVGVAGVLRTRRLARRQTGIVPPPVRWRVRAGR